MEKKDYSTRFSGLNLFLCRIAGADLNILAAHPHEIIRHARIGAIILCTALLATVSMFFALSTVSGSVFLATIGGLIWGGVIFILDSFIIASYRKSDDKWKEFRIVLPRLVLALVLGASISIPLELKVFSTEIGETMKDMNKKKDLDNYDLEKATYEKEIAPYMQEKENLKNETAGMKDQLKPYSDKVNKLENDLSDEIGSRGRTGKYGKGPVAEEIESQLDSARLARLKAETDFLPKMVYNNTRVMQLDSIIATVKQQPIVNSALGGISAQLDALKVLKAKNSHVRFAYWIFMLLILGIETAPIFVKLFSPKGSYDEVLAMNEYIVWLDQQKKKSDLHEKINNEIESVKAANKKSRDAQHLINDDILKEVALAQSEIARKAIDLWKKKELDKVGSEPDHFIRTTTN
jgi:hypothetical protein